MPSADPSEPVVLPVRDGEEPWTPKEVREQRKVLVEEPERLDKEVAVTDSESSDLLLQGNDGAGHDPVDVGSSNSERDQELSLAQGARGMADQARLALHLFDENQYGLREVCGNSIGKDRFRAFLRATMCVACKQCEGRR